MRRDLLLLLLIVTGCRPSASSSIEAIDPVRRIPAITQATSDDTAALFDALSDDDAAVRLAAINALRDRTGANYGYVYWQSPEQRRPAVERWREHLGLAVEKPATRP